MQEQVECNVNSFDVAFLSVQIAVLVTRDA